MMLNLSYDEIEFLYSRIDKNSTLAKKLHDALEDAWQGGNELLPLHVKVIVRYRDDSGELINRYGIRHALAEDYSPESQDLYIDVADNNTFVPVKAIASNFSWRRI